MCKIYRHIFDHVFNKIHYTINTTNVNKNNRQKIYKWMNASVSGNICNVATSHSGGTVKWKEY
jgi:hypothetical protein